MAGTTPSDSSKTSTSSDDEIVAALQQLAHSQALLFQAENDVTSPSEDAERVGQRNREIEEAHTKLLWSQAETLTAPRGDRTPKALEPHRKREQQVLEKFGFSSFDNYLDERARRPTNNINLAKARREYRSANDHWAEVLVSKGAPGPAVSGPTAIAVDAMPPVSTSKAVSSAGGPRAAIEGLTPKRIAFGLGVLALVAMAAFLVVKARGSTSSDSLATSPTIPITPTTFASTPTTSGVFAAPVGPSPTTAAKATPSSTGVIHTAALCAASKVFSLDDLSGLAQRAVADPKAMLRAYESMALTAPANLTPHMQALGPLTRQAIAEIQKGTIKTAPDLQKWLANAPQADLAQWIAAQGAVVPAMKEICAGA